MSTKLAIAALAGSAILGAFVVYNYYDNKEEAKKLNDKVVTLESSNKAQAASGENKDEHAETIGKIAADTGQLTNDVAGLRKSIKQLQARGSNSVEACNRALSVTGELLGECTAEYTEVAAKAERLKADVKALDKHVDILEELISDITELEPVK